MKILTTDQWLAAPSGAVTLILFLFSVPVPPALLAISCLLVGLSLGRRVLSPLPSPEEPLAHPYIPGGKSDES